MIPSTLFFFLKIALAIQSLLWFHANFRIICSSSVKNVMGILIGIALNLQIALGNMDILIILIFQSMNMDIFPLICNVFKFLHQCLIVLRVQVFHLPG